MEYAHNEIGNADNNMIGLHDKMKSGHNVIRNAHNSMVSWHYMMKFAHNGMGNAHSSIICWHDIMKFAHNIMKSEHNNMMCWHNIMMLAHNSISNSITRQQRRSIQICVAYIKTSHPFSDWQWLLLYGNIWAVTIGGSGGKMTIAWMKLPYPQIP